MQTLNEKTELLRVAIRDLKQVAGTYHGHPRLFCPHIVGTKEGRWKILVWQFGGSSSRPHTLPEWRDWFLAEMLDVTLRDGEWHRGWVTGQREQKAVDWVDTVVDPDHAAEVRHISVLRIPALGVPHRGRRR